MNILFSNIFYVSPTLGGTERVTYSVAKSLKKLGHKVYSLYAIEVGNVESSALFDESIHLVNITDTECLSKIISSLNIQAIIVQGAFSQVKWFRVAIKDNSKCRLYFAHHFEPAWELHSYKFISYWRKILAAKSIIGKGKKLAHLLLFPLEGYRYKKQLPIWYREAYENADKVILLTKGFIPQYKEFAGITEESKFTIIPNMLSFDHFESSEGVKNKEKIVLIVSRMYETQKRISLALMMWRECVKDRDLTDWDLYMVGDGPELDKYKLMVKNDDIPNVTFFGKQDPLPFYQRAAIFMMTSLSEAWGLTLTESMQNGVVPLAFNTYASLRDIITDDSVGYAIEEGNLEEYISRMKYLMKHPQARQQMAMNCIESSKRFESCVVGEIWNNLIISQ